MRFFYLIIHVYSLCFYIVSGFQSCKQVIIVQGKWKNKYHSNAFNIIPGYSSIGGDMNEKGTPIAEQRERGTPFAEQRHSKLGKFGDFINGILYTDKESNRKFRRTIFTKYNWRRHRSSSRYFQELMNMPKSVILRGLGAQTLVVTFCSLLIVSYNTLVEMKKFPFPMPLFSIPALPFALTSSSLGLLLVFRTNAAYSRWKDARISWALISARSFDLMRQAMIFITDESCKSRLVRYICAFAKVTKWHLGHQVISLLNFHPNFIQILSLAQSEM